MKFFSILICFFISIISLNAQFAERTNLSSNLAVPKTMDIGDMDGDGKKDILISEQGMINTQTGEFISDGGLTWFKNNGDNTFLEDTIVVSNTHFIEAALIDWDGDGDKDIYGRNSGGKHIYYNQGGGEFTESFLELSDDIDGFRLYDIDNDGDSDMTIQSDGLYYIFIDNGQGFPNDITSLPSYSAMRSSGNFIINSFFGDIDADGDFDIFAPAVPLLGGVPSHWIWLEQTSEGDFTEHMISEYSEESELYLEDLDADGDVDLVCQCNQGSIEFFENDGAGNFASPVYLLTPIPNNTDTEVILVEDIDLDGKPDILYSDFTNSKTVWHRQLDNSVFGGPIILPGSSEFYGAKVGQFTDIDDDGDGDFIYYAWSSAYLFENKFIGEGLNIYGLAFHDENENGIREINENFLTDIPVRLEEGEELIYEGIGSFNFNVQANSSYSVSCMPYSGWELTTPAPLIVTTTDTLLEPERNFGLKAISNDKQLELNITSAATRCGFTVPFWLSVKNTGFSNESGTVELTIDDLSTFQNAVPAPSTINGNVLSWNFEDLPPTQFERIRIELLMANADFIGEYVQFLASGIIDDDIESNVFTDVYDSQINCAYDPNDKSNTPNYPADYTLMGDTIDYVIRFQNTGTDTAFTVRLEDIIDENLDLSSLKVISSSHDYDLLIRSDRTMVITFEDILLPDSTTNLSESQGFFKYSLTHNENLEESTLIRNKANIYFDFNENIETNEVKNRMVTQYPLYFLPEPSCGDSLNGSIEAVPFFFYQDSSFFNFEWSTGDTTFIIDNLSPGTYSLTVTEPTGDTIFIGESTVESIDFSFTTEFNSTLGNFNIGSATVINEDTNPPYSYLWNTEPPQETQTVTNLGEGIYSVTVTDGSGCQNTSNVNISEESIEYQLMHPTCFDRMDGSLSIETEFAPLDFSWNTGETNAQINNLGSGEYTLSLSTPSFPNLFDTLFILESPDEILLEITSVPSQNNLDNGTATVAVTGGVEPYTFIWNTIPPQTTATADNLTMGDYSVVVTDGNNCLAEIMTTVEGIVNTENYNSKPYSIYPNPISNSEKLNFVFPEEGDYKIKFLDFMGHLIESYTLEGQTSTVVEIGYLQTGIYTVSIENKAGISLKKIIVL